MLQLKTSVIRDAVRIKMERPIWIRNGEGAFESASLVDLSEKGAAVDWPTSILVGEIHLVLKLKEGSYLSLEASRAWQKSGRVGLRIRSNGSRLKDFLGTQMSGRSTQSLF